MLLLYYSPENVDGLSYSDIDKLTHHIPCSSEERNIKFYDFEYYCETKKWVDLNEHVGYYEDIPASDYIEELKYYYQVEDAFEHAQSSIYTLKKYSEKFHSKGFFLLLLHITSIYKALDLTLFSGFYSFAIFFVDIFISIILYKFVVLKIIEKKHGFIANRKKYHFRVNLLLDKFSEDENYTKLQKTEMAAQFISNFYGNHASMCAFSETVCTIAIVAYTLFVCFI